MIFQNIPLLLLAAATILLVLLSIEAGYRLGVAIHHHLKSDKESPVSVISGAILGLLGFLLAFTFQILYNRFDERKQLVRDEAVAIRTAWLRSDFMQEPDHGKAVTLLKEYVDMRIAAVQSSDADKMQKALKESDLIQQKLWNMAVANVRKDMNSDVAALYIGSLNEVFSIHSLRITRGLQARAPLGLWLGLYALLVFGMLSIGYQTAVAGSRRTLASIILSISFTIVTVLIISLDRPHSGFFKVSQQPLINLQESMAGNSESDTVEQP